MLGHCSNGQPNYRTWSAYSLGGDPLLCQTGLRLQAEGIVLGGFDDIMYLGEAILPDTAKGG